MDRQISEIEQLWSATGTAMRKAKLFREHLETADAEARGQQEPSYIGGSESDS